MARRAKPISRVSVVVFMSLPTWPGGRMDEHGAWIGAGWRQTLTRGRQHPQAPQVCTIGPKGDEPQAGEELAGHGEVGREALAPAHLLELAAVPQAGEHPDRAWQAAPGDHLVDHDLDLEAVAPTFRHAGEHLPPQRPQTGDGRQPQKERIAQPAIRNDAAGEPSLA